MPGITPAITPFITGTPDPSSSPALVSKGTVEKLQPGRYMLRHIAPAAANEAAPGIYHPFAKGVAVLGQTLYADPLPQLRQPTSPDWHEGAYTLRILDAAEWNIGFPNKDASDGQPWRTRFDTTGHKEFIEISREGELEAVGVIVKQVRDRGKITISGYDGLFLLKKAFEQDWTGVTSPQALIERYTEPPVMAFYDEFDRATLGPEWIEFTEGAGSKVSIIANILRLEAGSGPSGLAFVRSNALPVLTDRWSMRVDIAAGSSMWNPVGGAGEQVFQIAVGLPGKTFSINLFQKQGVFAILFESEGLVTPNVGIETPFTGPTGGTHSLQLESDGKYVRGYVDGVFVGITRVPSPGIGVPVPVSMQVHNTVTGINTLVSVERVVVRHYLPFLMRGPEKGQYLLPGGVGAYPTGGLHCRYRPWSGPNDVRDGLAPDPRAPGFPQFKETQENCNIAEPGKAVGIGPPLTIRMFGAIYLPLSKGNVQLILARSGVGVAFRCWVGKMGLGQQVVDDFQTSSSATEVAGTVNAAALGGKDGWYPIVIEFAHNGPSGPAIAFVIVPNGTYVDPGGTTLTFAVGAIVPATSLSPIGCVDTRIQGSSFFDIVTETAKNWGLQLRCEPRSLESGEFPGRIVPRERLGHDTDEIMEAGDIDRRSEFNNYTATEDATDIATSLKAFGSGIADGRGSQVAFEALDPEAEANALFDLESWLSAGDIAFPQLLVARANAELGLRTDPWLNVEGEPIARDRLADTFPLTGVLSQFRWQPGDGIRLRLPDVAVEDVVPRQILQITRNFSPDGRTGTALGFRSRPKDPIHVLRTALREATRSPRAFQHQYVTRVSEHVGSNNAGVANGAFSTWMIVPLDPQEKVVSAVAFLTLTSGAGSKVGIEIGTGGAGVVNRTAALGGPWTFATPIDISPFASSVAATNDHRLYVRFKNETGSEINIEGQVVVTILA